MKANKRFLSLFLLLSLLVVILPITASANSPAPSPVCVFGLSNLPQGTVYVDLLIPLDSTDFNYVALVEENLTEGISVDSEIVAFHQDGFCSYTFHYRDAKSVIRVDAKGKVLFFSTDLLDYDAPRYGHQQWVYENEQIRLAMLDAQGNILKLSPVLTLRPREFSSYMLGNFNYNAEAEVFVVESAVSTMAGLIYFFLCGVALVLTVILESLLAVPFRLRMYSPLIRRTNVVSQVLMHACYILLYRFLFWKYTLATLVLEVLVYAGEFLFYRWKMADVSWKRCLLYTVTANTVSLLVGMLLLSIL